MDCSTPGFPVHHQLPELAQTRVMVSLESVIPSKLLIFCHPLLLLPSIFPSIRVFSNELALRIRWPNYWSFSFSISPSNEHPGLISFRMYWLDLLAVQGTLKSLLQHHSSKDAYIYHIFIHSSLNGHLRCLDPWKKSYDQSRQHIKKQRHYFANKCP